MIGHVIKYSVKKASSGSFNLQYKVKPCLSCQCYGAIFSTSILNINQAEVPLASNKFYPVKYEFWRLIKIFFAAGIIYLAAGVFIKAQGTHVFLMKVILFLSFPLSLHLMAFYRGGEKNKINGYRQRARKFIYGKLRFGNGVL